jgi:endo-1,4-beta-xylanase
VRSKHFFSALVACLTLAICGSSNSGANSGSGGSTGSGGSSSGGTTGSGGSASGGTTGGSGGRGGAGGAAGRAGKGGTSGATGTGGSPVDGSVTVDCTATLPSGGTTYMGNNVNGMSDGLNYGIWSNSTNGGSITVFPNAHAFSASWNNSMDFLAHVGLDWYNASKPYTAYGTIQAEFSEVKSGTPGSFSSIGIYGWMHSPCIEWYINEDSYSSFVPKGSTTAMIDGEMYYLSTSQTNGTAGANDCESGHTGAWTNITATRAAHRTCGTVTVSDHFASWEAQGWTLGTLVSVHINVEVGGGMGTIDFPVANVTTTSK